MNVFDSSEIAYKNGYNKGVEDTINKLKEIFTNSLYTDTYISLNNLSKLIEKTQNELLTHN